MNPNTQEPREKRTVAIIPIKSLVTCKQRLADLFRPEQRASLMLAMLADVITVLRKSRWPEQIWVISSDPFVLDHACKHGALPIMERSDGLDTAVTQALSLASASRMEAALVVHGDLPAITVSEVLTIRAELAEAATGAVGVVGSKDGGTSALYLCPVTAMLPQFGVDSGRAHMERALASRLTAHLIHLPGFSCDIDVPADIEAFIRQNHPGRTSQFLASCLYQKV